MNDIFKIKEISEVPGVNGGEKDRFSRDSLDKYDKLFGDDTVGQPDMTEEERNMMREVYNPEIEFDFPEFDFEDEELKNSLDYFNDINWEELSDAEKEAAVSQFAECLADKLEISETPEISFCRLSAGHYGSYYPIINVIEINEELLDDPEELVDTIAHEMRHAYQHERSKKGETHMDALYQYNLEHYVSVQRDKWGNAIYVNEYQNQLVEVEARAFAERIAGSMED